MKNIVLALCLLCGFGTIAQASSVTTLNGVGATFPYPLYLKMVSVYKEQYNVNVNYQAIGSGGGIRNIILGIVDFGASDAPMTKKEEEEAKTPILHIPIVVGSVVLAYNLPLGSKEQLVFTPSVIEKIYSGDITHWNDKEIQKINPSISLPAIKIVPVYRADGSGTTYIFTEYLSKISEEWSEVYGVGKSIAWATGVGQKGNAGVAGYIKNTVGTIGYLELAYAEQNKLALAELYNSSGYHITRENLLTSTEEASDVPLPSDLKASLTNCVNAKGNPIASFTWVLLRKEQKYNGRTREQAKAVQKFVAWMLTEGQQYARPLFYAPLSKVAQQKALTLLNTLTYDGKPL